MDLIRRASLRRAALRLRVCRVYFATRKQGVEESRRFETPLAVIFVTIESKTVIKYLLLVVSPKAFFKVLASAMAISHYAAVFFCAQRNRVTLGAQRRCDCFCKDGRGHQYRDRPARFRHENILHASKPHQIKILNVRKLSHAGASDATPDPAKSPAWPGFYDTCLFRSAHFASLAIWCESRETLRLALFL